MCPKNMYINMRYLFVLTAFVFATMAVAADKVSITVGNKLGASRAGEMVEVSLEQIKKKLPEAFIITDADGNEIPSQQTYDGKLIFQVGVGAKGKSVYYAVEGTPKQYDKRVMGRLFTERQDEFGWENDRIAYRIYGHGGAVGYDIFNKSTSKLMLDFWYKSEQDSEMRSVTKKLRDRGYGELADEVYNAFCYHINHGEGMDCYTVGPTLGAGANALLAADGSLFMPKCYQKYEVLDNGPLRFTVKLTYPEAEYNGAKVVETRIISIDAGSNFCRVQVSYAGLAEPAQMASGVVVHKQNPSAYVLSKDNGYIGYEDLGDAGTYSYIPKRYHEKLASEMGRIFVGTVYPAAISAVQFAERPNGAATGHAIATATSLPSTTYTYYFGTAWDGNKEVGIDTLTDWEAQLSKQARQVRTPLTVKVK